LWRIAGELLPARAPGRFNEALMELGALVCTPRAPRCDACPLRPHCVAHARGRVDRFPTPRVRRAPALRVAVAAIVESRRGVWLEEKTAGVNRGLLELPSVEDGADVPADALWARLRRRLGVPRSASRHLGTIRHGILERRYRVDVWHARVTGPSDGPWRRRDRMESLPLTARTRRARAPWEKARA
jgi:A/G-specific adenine glycosylase